MLDAYQRKLVAPARAGSLPERDWFELVNLLQVARVPIHPDEAAALSMAAGNATPGEAPSPQEIPHQPRALLDDLGRSVDDPFMVVDWRGEISAIMPPDMPGMVAIAERGAVAARAGS
jgi:hypothetical protein